MKARNVIATVGATLVLGAGGVTAYALYNQEPTVENSTPEVTKVQKVQEVTPEVVETPQETPQETSQVVVEQPQEPIVPTNEDLIVQYGWTVDPFKTSINSIIAMVPQFFTDEKREASFEYLNVVCSKLGANISYCFNIMLTSRVDKATTWVTLGKRAGVDTSLYE